MALGRMWESDYSTNMGLPVPGVELKLVPRAGKLEARCAGRTSRRATGAAGADRESLRRGGFYKLGDALKFEDPTDPAQGLLFDGRLAEDFKLSTGTG